MSKLVDSFNYGVDSLKMTREEFFYILEKSENYSGEDYSYWLASKVLEFAKSEGVSLEQLISKKSELLKGSFTGSINTFKVDDEYLEYILNTLIGDKKLFTYGEIVSKGESLDRVDWGSKIDYDEYNAFFVDECLPENLGVLIKEDKDFTILCKVGLNTVFKESDLYLDAKCNNITFVDEFDLLLYRFVTMAKAFPLSKGRFDFIIPGFLLSKGSKTLYYFLEYFNVVRGFCVPAKYLREEYSLQGDMMYVSFKIKGDDKYKAIELPEFKLDRGRPQQGWNHRYTRTDKLMLESLKEDADGGDVFGYLCVDGYNCLIQKEMSKDFEYCIPITEDNLKDTIVLFGVWVSCKEVLGYTPVFNQFVSGLVGYDELMYNCIPLLLYHYNVFVDMSPYVEALFDFGKEYICYEAEDFDNNCRGFKAHINGAGFVSNILIEVKDAAQHPKFNNYYAKALENLCNYVYNSYQVFV